MNLKETGASLHMVEQIRTQPGQQTMFWQVMQEDGVAVQSLGKETSLVTQCCAFGKYTDDVLLFSG